ncbi:MAG: hypothetical protein RL632_612 [Bacteroidota bacterium]|jgi:hypothetical protein
MNNWFTVKVKYTKQLENGTFKRVSEPYLLAAMTFTDAEARIYEELGSVIRGEFDVVGISRTEIHDIFAYEDAYTWYKAKISYEREDGEGEDAKKKKISQNFLVSAHSVKDAYERIRESLSTLMIDYQIPAIIVSPIVDIFPPNENLDREISRTPMEKEEKTPAPKGKVFSAPGSDIDDEDFSDDDEVLEDDLSDDEDDNEDESVLEDDFSDED